MGVDVDVRCFEVVVVASLFLVFCACWDSGAASISFVDDVVDDVVAVVVDFDDSVACSVIVLCCTVL